MKLFYRIVILTILLLLAVACMLIGSSAGFGFFLIIGIMFEAAFWIGLFNIRKQRRASSN